MFTHSGITGPLVLSASAHIGTALKKNGELYSIFGPEACTFSGAVRQPHSQRV